MSEISSGLVAVAWQHSQRGLGDSEWQDWKTISWKPQGPESELFRMRPLCVLSDAEAIIAEKDAEIEGWKFDLADALDMKAGKGPTVLNWQAERIKELEAHTTTLEEVIASQRENVTSLATEVVDKDAEIERLNNECDRLAKAASKNYRDNGLLINEEFYKQAERIKELESDVDEEAHIRDRMAKLLAETAVALKGPEKALHRHGWQDLPDVAAKQSAALKLAKDALESCDVGDYSTGHVITPSFDAVAVYGAIAAINALGE